jgi:hypothetical protein
MCRELDRSIYIVRVNGVVVSSVRNDSGKRCRQAQARNTPKLSHDLMSRDLIRRNLSDLYSLIICNFPEWGFVSSHEGEFEINCYTEKVIKSN